MTWLLDYYHDLINNFWTSLTSFLIIPQLFPNSTKLHVIQSCGCPHALSLSPHTYCYQAQQFSPVWHQQSGTAGEWPTMQFSLAFSVGGFPFFLFAPQPPHSSVPTPSQPPNQTQLYTSWTYVYTFPASECWHMTNQRSNKQLVLNNFPPTAKGWKINKSLSVWPGQAIW